jgi:ketosteroid isomerase-like protein
MELISTKTDRDQLSELNARFIQNFITQDAAAHDKIIHKDFICIESNGQIVEREKYLRSWAHDYDNSGYITFSYSDEVIRIFGNTALVISKTTYTKEVNGSIITGHSIYTDTYVKENGKWLCVQAHITPVKYSHD